MCILTMYKINKGRMYMLYHSLLFFILFEIFTYNVTTNIEKSNVIISPIIIFYFYLKLPIFVISPKQIILLFLLFGITLYFTTKQLPSSSIGIISSFCGSIEPS